MINVNLSEMGCKVCPKHHVLVYQIALSLRLRMEMLCEEFTIVSAHPLSLAQTLISVEGQLLLLQVKLLRLLCEHKFKSFVLVAE